MTHYGLAAFAFALLFAIAGCEKEGGSTPSKTEPAKSATPATAPAAPPAAPAAVPAAPAAPAAPAKAGAALLDPSLAKEKAPEKFRVKCATTKGDFVIEVTREWSPLGADRFYNLVKIGYFADISFFRNIEGFMVQFGIHGDPAVNEKWRDANIQDDPVKQSNQEGFITFATGGPNTRTTQVFINHGDNRNLDAMGFSPFGKVVEGLAVVKALYQGYGEGAPQGSGPEQGRLQFEGSAYLKKEFPRLDYLKTATIIP